jgi:hypothetical protein
VSKVEQAGHDVYLTHQVHPADHGQLERVAPDCGT